MLQNKATHTPTRNKNKMPDQHETLSFRYDDMVRSRRKFLQRRLIATGLINAPEEDEFVHIVRMVRKPSW